MGRREHYVEEQDAAHDVIYGQIAEPCFSEQISRRQLIGRIIGYPANVLVVKVHKELMRMDYPFEYQLIRDYYLSEKAVSMMYLAKKYAMTPKKVEYRINKAKRLLREYIIAHENEE